MQDAKQAGAMFIHSTGEPDILSIFHPAPGEGKNIQIGFQSLDSQGEDARSFGLIFLGKSECPDIFIFGQLMQGSQRE